MIRSSLAAAVAAGVLFTAAAAPAQAADAADGCPKGFRCSMVDVPLDRTGATPGTLSLRVARHAASAGEGKPMLLALTGGPGQPAIPFGPQFAHQLRRALSGYQLVLFDQRGTGASGALRCPALQRAGEFPSFEAAVAATTKCAAELGVRAGDFGTHDSVEDIEAVRAAVGAEKIALIGTSYGTHVIQRYLLAHPDRVDRIVLDSPVAPGGVDAFERESYGASARILKKLGRDAEQETRRLVTRLAGRPLTGRVFDERGRPRRAALTTSAEVFGLLVAGDMSSVLRRQFAAAVRAANRGDSGPLLRLHELAQAPPPPPTEISAGLYAATMCLDTTLPWAQAAAPDAREAILDAAVAALDPATLGAFDVAAARDTSVAAGCLPWPAVDRRPDAVPEAYAPVPALVLSGLSDLRTPVENARAIAARLPGATVVTVAGTGHDVLGSDVSGCAQRALDRFMSARDVGEPCRGVTNRLDSGIRAFPHAVADLPLAPHTKGRAGRALTGALLTVIDAGQVMLTRLFSGASGRAGGLRGGSVAPPTRRHAELKLDHYAFVPGLRVTGTLGVARWSLRLSGAAHGTVRLRDRRVVATIDGHRLSVPAAGAGSPVGAGG